MNSLRSIWNQMPAVRLLLPYLIGIAVLIYTSVGAMYTLYIAFAALGIALFILIYVNAMISAVRIYRWRYVSGLAVFSAMLSLGAIVTFFHTESNNPHHFSHFNDRAGAQQLFIGLVSDPIVVRQKTVSVPIQMQKIVRGDTTISVGGILLANIKKDKLSTDLRYGDQLIIRGVVMDYEDAPNPDQFDYKRYQAFHHIYHRVYLRNGDWHIIKRDQGSPLLSYVYQIRTYFLSLIKQCVHGSNKLAVATAILLGYRDYMTDSVMQAYTGSGVLHVLSVSGLHVAILYYVLNMLLGWMDSRRRLEIVKGILVISIMIFYAGLTGFSPPVLRSVWMFILITIARILDRQVSMYNILAVSCLLMLLWDPYYVADVGFQLSYIAVVGIVYLYPLIYRLIPIRSLSLRQSFGMVAVVVNYLLHFIWSLISVSIAAQLATLPLSLYYFHTFPNLFLLANIIVIPLSNFILISGMTLFVVGWYHPLFAGAGWLLDHLLRLLNEMVFWIDRIPFALSQGLVLTTFEMILCYMILAVLCWYINNKGAKALILTLILLLTLCTDYCIEYIKKGNTQKLMVYDVPGKKAIAFLLYTTAYYDFDSALVYNEPLLRYTVKNNWWHSGIVKEVPIDSTILMSQWVSGRMYTINRRKVLVMDKSLDTDSTGYLDVDLLILSDGVKNSIESIGQKVTFKKIIFDSSIKPIRLRNWIKECDKANIPYHNCRLKAFEMGI